MDVVTLGAALSIMKKMPDTAASSAAAAEDAADRAEAAAEQAEGAIEVDDTLSVKGRAADAAATGKIKDDLAVVTDIVGLPPTVEKENVVIYANTGGNFTASISSNNRVSTKPIYVPEGSVYKVNASGFGRYLYTTSQDGITVASASVLISSDTVERSFTGPVYFRMAFANATDTPISTESVIITITDTVNGTLKDRIDGITDIVGTLSTDVGDIKSSLIYKLVPYTVTTGYMKENGTIQSSAVDVLAKYTPPSGLSKILINGTSGMSVTSPKYCVLWFVQSGEMIESGYIPVTKNPQTWNMFEVDVPEDCEEIWMRSTISVYVSDKEVSQRVTDIESEINGINSDINNINDGISYIENLISNLDDIDSLGSQWKNKVWYAYGTSLTNVSAEGKYPTYLAQMSGLTLVNKGMSGGGIGNLGAYSTGQVYNAVCNITDGKLDADLITLETGANDIADTVPLGTVFDTGRSTLAGCLNDCIQYLQTNTTAQICIIPSPIGKQTLDKALQWAEMIRQICDINRVTYLSSNFNVGRARANSNQGSNYLVDNIHQTQLGGYNFALYLWHQLRNIPRFYTAMPNL